MGFRGTVVATHTIFYSWQSDLPNSTNRGFIEECIERSIREVRSDEELKLDPCLDRDTAGVPGSPDIVATIFGKIKAADIFVGDVSFIDGERAKRRTPNPNVLVELGYAAALLGWEKIICVFNRATGEINDLPFDIRQRRVRSYELVQGQEKADQKRILASVLRLDITDILHAPEKSAAEALDKMLTDISSELQFIIIFGSELEERTCNPWLTSLRYTLGRSATIFRKLASTDTAIENVLAGELEQMAGCLDEAAHIQLDSFSFQQFKGLVCEAVRQAQVVKAAWIDAIPRAGEWLERIREKLILARRHLDGLSARSMAMLHQGRMNELRSEASQIGLTLLQISFYKVDELHAGIGEQIHEIGRDLHIIETIQLVSEGPDSPSAIVQRIQRGSNTLAGLVESL